MRHSNHPVRGRRRLPAWAVGLIVVVIAACGSSSATPPASVVPTPSPTPDPHLSEPVTADQLYGILTAAKLGMTANNANLGHGDPNIVKQINGAVAGWPLRITEYRSGAVLRKALGWKSGAQPTGDEAPYAWAALNVLVEFGPISARKPAAPDAGRQATAATILGILDPLLWPIDQHAVVAIPARSPEPTAAPSPSAAPSKAPGKTPKPSPSKKP